MRHVILTCKNHPNLRWSTKACACNEGGKPGDPALYNSTRHIFFMGEPTGDGMFDDLSGLQCSTFIVEERVGDKVVKARVVTECACSARDLVIAPEDALVKRYPRGASGLMFDVAHSESNNFRTTLSPAAYHCVARAQGHLAGKLEGTFPSTHEGEIIPFGVSF